MYIPLKNLSHFSLRRSIQKPEQIIKRAAALGMSACGLTDFCTLAGVIEFQDAAKAAGIKPIFGVKFKTPDGYITTMAKNKVGWFNLIKLISKSHDSLHNGVPITGLGLLQQYSDGLIAICGSSQSLFDDVSANNIYTIESIKNIFNGNLYMDIHSSEINSRKEELRELAKKAGIKCAVSSESIFSRSEDVQDYKILACTDLRTTLKELTNVDSSLFFRSEGELSCLPEEIAHSQEIADQCEQYSITNKPKLPKFNCPNGLSEADYLNKLIYESPRWNNSQEFIDRLAIERPVISEAELDGYFLIVNDYAQFARSKGHLVAGRGSAAGCLISYLLGLTVANPLTYNLLFERFYNSGRNTKDHVSYPDIDMDFPKEFREEVIEYIRDKYGRDRVGQIITFGRMQGAGALKEVLRAHSAADVATQNLITAEIPEEAKISDELEADNEDSIIRWVLHNQPEIVKDYARIGDDGSIVGDYAQYFEQAIRIEGVYRTSGKHAAGLIISPEPLENICPMVSDKDGNKMIGFDMHSAEKSGLIKMDILGVAGLDKLGYARNLIRGF